MSENLRDVLGKLFETHGVFETTFFSTEEVESRRRILADAVLAALPVEPQAEKAAANNQCYPCFMQRCWRDQSECDGGSCGCSHARTEVPA